jgi:hypothetical protein
MLTANSQKNSNHAAQAQASELLEWLIDFLPGAIPRSAE